MVSNSTVVSNSSVGSDKGGVGSLPVPSYGSHGNTQKESIVFKNG